MKEINLEEILEDHLKNFGINGFYGIKSLNYGQIELITSAMKEACRQTLGLAAENAEIVGYYEEPCMSGGIRLKKFKRTWKNDRLHLKVKTNLTIDKESILDTINQIK